MPQQNASETARMMLRLHGLRAQAIALERVSEMRQQGDAQGLDHWRQIHLAICELRQAANHRRFGDHQEDRRS